VKKYKSVITSNLFLRIFCFVFARASVSDALFFGEKYISISNARFETEVLLESLLDVERIFFRTDPGFTLSLQQRLRFVFWLRKRNNQVPVAYILGYKDWAGLRINVNRHTLIPRDETEVLLEHIKAFDRDTVPTNVLDIGTGSGCIALALQRNFLDTSVTALDISVGALKIAQKNEQDIFGAKKIEWMQSYFLCEIRVSSRFDLIVANLPYVPTKIAVTAEVQKEPSTAIFSGADGLDHIRRLASQLKTKKIRFKELWLEFLPEQEKKIASIFAEHQVRFLADIGGDIYFAVVFGQK
jgi:release factor glutamine methyltransferase